MKVKRLNRTNVIAAISIMAASLSMGQLACRSTPEETGGASSRNEHMVNAVLWSQTAAEARALCYQSFNLAQMKLDEELQRRKGSQKLAVIVDIDETVLDNSPYEARLIETNQRYPAGWPEWIDLARAQSVPGAREFLTYAAARGVEIFYVSNRKEATREGTVKNLFKLGFPFAQDDHVLLRTTDNSKGPRRKAVGTSHEIVFLMGDNLNDFSDLFENRSVSRRAATVDSLRNEFGRKFIVLPNPMYGDWENAVYEHDMDRSDEEKDRLRKAAIEGY